MRSPEQGLLARYVFLLGLDCIAVAAAERPTIPILDAPTLTAACTQAIADAKAAYARLEELPVEQASVASVLDAWDDTFIALEDVGGPVSTLVNVHPDAKVRDAGRSCRAKISSFLSEVQQSDKLFERVKAVKTANAVERELQNDIVASFEDSGVTLPKDKRARAKEISDRITALSQEYNKNIRDNNTKLTFTPAEYEGLPRSYIDRVKKPDGTIEVTLDNPDYFPFMASSANGEARKRYYIAFFRRGGARNLAILEEVVKLGRSWPPFISPILRPHALGRRMGDSGNRPRVPRRRSAPWPRRKRNLAELRKSGRNAGDAALGDEVDPLGRTTGASDPRAALQPDRFTRKYILTSPTPRCLADRWTARCNRNSTSPRR